VNGGRLLKVSVLIPNYNGIRFLEGCLGSLRRQHFTDYEVIVVDDASTDGSVGYVRRTFPEVRVIPLVSNGGFSRSTNRGIQEARGEYVALLNNDTIIDPDWLGELVSALDAHPEVDFCASRLMYYHQRSLIDSAGDGYYRGGMAYKIGHGKPFSNHYGIAREVFGPCAAASIYRRSFFELVGLFDDDLVDYGTDVDLNFRAQLLGLRCRYVPTAVVYHWEAGSTDDTSPNFIRRINRNGLITFFKDYPLGLAIVNWRAIVHTFFYTLVTMPYPMAALSGRVLALTLLPSVLRKRWSVQKQRRVPLCRLAVVMDIQ
jgi:GT2 family glycosyltransferase